MRKKLLSYLLPVLLCCCGNLFYASAQTTITAAYTGGASANPPANGVTGNSAVTFLVENTNATGRMLTGVSIWQITTNSPCTYTLWYSTSSLNGAPTIAAPAWTQVVPSSSAITVATNGYTTIFSGLQIIINAGQKIRFAVQGSAGITYAGTTASPATPTQFSGDGVNLYTGGATAGGTGNVGYGGAFPSPANTPRSFPGSITIDAVPSCISPATVSASAITASSATLNWASVSGATGYEYAVTTSSTPPASGTATAATTAPSGALSSNTQYYIHVRTACGASFSSWTTGTFRTLCSATNIPYTENFDAAATFPNCFTLQDLNGNTTWTVFAGTAGTTASSGTNSIRYNWNTPTGADDWFFIQGLNLTAGTSYRLKFNYKASDGPTYVEKLEVKYGSAANAASMTAGTIFTNTNINSALADPFAQAAVDFTPSSSGTFYIGFHCFSIPDQAFLYIDDINVDLSPSCPNPTVTVSNVTNATATLNWNIVAGALGYEWAVTTSATPPASGTSTTSTTANPSGLSATTQYYAHVRTSCTGGVFSSWSTMPFFTTLDCSAATVITACRSSQTASIAPGTGAYDVVSCGFNTPGVEKLYSFTPSVSGNYVLNITAANGNYIDYFYKDASLGCGPTGWTCIDDNGAVGTDVFGPLTAGVTYYILLDPEDNTVTSTHTFQIDCPVPAPPNDLVCNATALTLGGPQDCQNTLGATSTSDPAFTCSTPNNTTWYTYTPATTGPVIIRTEIPAGSAAPLDGWIGIYTATGTCPSLTLTQFNTTCDEFGITAGAIDSILSPVLTAGVTYYIMIDGVSGSTGEYCISLVAPPSAPSCTTNIAPANGATGVTTVAGNVALSWNAAATATSYDVYFGPTNTPPLLGNTTATTVNITGTSYNTTYYWYIVPRNTGGAATGCISNMTSFTTENPTNCTPSYTTGCTAADSLTFFSLRGSTAVVYNNSGSACTTSPAGYSDYTTSFSPIPLSRGETFGGKMRTGDPNDYATIWIDGNDNGYFEDNERVLNNLLIGTTLKMYSIYVPTSMALGQHRMRVRIVYYATAPTALTHPCNPYTYGETEDYLVNITNVGTTRAVAAGTPGSCIETTQTTIGPESNNHTATRVFLLDSLNNYVAGLSPNGNDWGLVQGGVYVHNGSVRQTPAPQNRYYLDRNINIGTQKPNTQPYSLRYFYLNSELNALIAQPGSGVTSQFDLNMTKTQGIECVNQYVQQSPEFVSPTGFGSLGGDRFLDFTGLTGFSRFFLHGGANILVPIRLGDFYGRVTGATNTVYWTTETEQNTSKFIVERSTDGANFTAIGELPSQAINGNSSVRLSYQFIDGNPVEGKSFYRLRIVETGGRETASQIVSLVRGKGRFEIVDVRPNPTTGLVYFNLVGGNIGSSVVVRSMNGSEVMRKQLAQTGTFSIDMSGLANGLYILEATDRNGDKATFKINKQ